MQTGWQRKWVCLFDFLTPHERDTCFGMMLVWLPSLSTQMSLGAMF